MALSVISCKEDEPYGQSDRSPVELSAGYASDGMMTKATVTDGSGKTVRAFTGDTRLFFMVVAEDETVSPTQSMIGYNYAKAAAAGSEDAKSDVAFDGNYLYWDDAYARDTKISVYSVAAAGAELDSAVFGPEATAQTVGTSAKVINFSSALNTPVVSWEIGDGSAQDSSSFSQDDLVFSNNIVKVDDSHDYRLRYRETAGGHHKFDKGELVYYHALSRVTVRIVCGDGFKGDGTDFSFTSVPTGADNSFAVNGFYGKGTFDVAEGEFTPGSLEVKDFSSICLSRTDVQKVDPYYTLEAYLVPGTDIENGTVENAFTFEIDNNRYDISMKELHDLLETVDEFLAGVHYQFTFIVSKTKVSGFSAKVVDWEDVTADEHEPSNARISLSLEDRGTSVTSGVDFYRSLDPGNTSGIFDTYQGYLWSTGYEKKSSDWFWPGNTSFYHFRAVGDKSDSSAPSVVSNEGGDYFGISAGEIYHDYIWGAPFKEMDGSADAPDDAKFVYSNTLGFDGIAAHQISYAIGPTKDVIRLLMMHVMSNVTFELVTSSDDAAVSFGDGTPGNITTITLEQIHKSGKVNMGNGLVETTDARSDYEFTTVHAQVGNKITWSDYGAVPQSLEDVVLVIKTADNNLYTVDMENVMASSVSTKNIVNPYEQVSGKYRIDRWYPDYNYKYTFKLTKKGAESLEATILDWEDVVAGDDNVQIK